MVRDGGNKNVVDFVGIGQHNGKKGKDHSICPLLDMEGEASKGKENPRRSMPPICEL
jgi:hypothetical protein